MSGFLANALSGLGGGGAGGSAAAGGLLSEAFSAMGGVSGIVSRFQQAGLGDKAQSWVGNGSNAPLGVDELTRVFPPQQIENWASQHGVPAGVAAEVLSLLLPHAVDSQTPGGQIAGGSGSPAATPAGGDDPFADGTGGQEAAAGQASDAGAPSGGGFDFGGLVQRMLGGGRS